MNNQKKSDGAGITQQCRQEKENHYMQGPFAKSISTAEKSKKLLETVSPEDTLAILIKADPDAIASALALKRLFWRKARKVDIVRIDKIERADNLAFVRLLNLKPQHIRNFKISDVSKWATVDSQPDHHDEFKKFRFDIIIDHHPATDLPETPFIDIQEDYGSNSTILTEYLKSSGIKPSPRLATALFYGIKTDTDNFVRGSATNDIKAFRHLYEYANLNIIKKIESSEITKKTLSSFKTALDKLTVRHQTAFVHMGDVGNADTLVMVADFFMKMAEATWSIVSGISDRKLIVIFRNAGFRRDAGKLAIKMFGQVGSAGGHKSMARAEIPLEQIGHIAKKATDIEAYVKSEIKKSRQNLV